MPQVMAERPAQTTEEVRPSFRPSRYQQAIFDFQREGEGSCMVNAVAGSGKTTTIVQTANQMTPFEKAQAAFCAFNKHIATELRAKLPASMSVNTIHAFCMGALRNYVKPDSEEWVDSNKYRKLARIYWKRRGRNTWKEPHLVFDVCDALRMVMLTRTDVTDFDAFAAMCLDYDCLPDRMSLGELQSAVVTLLDWGLHGTGDSEFIGIRQAISFDDMLHYCLLLDVTFPRFQSLFVDEVQDLSPAQREILFRMTASNARIYCVGDPQQSIYRFAGADAYSYQRIREALGGADLPLSICYRCPVSHIQMAQRIVPHIEAREDAPAGIIANARYEDLPSAVEAGDMILCRTTAPLIELAFLLIGAGVPAKVRGRDIGESLYRIAESVSRDDRFQFVWLAQAIEDYRELKLIQLRSRPDTELEIESVNDRVNSLLLLVERAQREGIASMEAFREYVNRFFDDRAGIVTLSTIHKAKGLENDRVFLLRPDLMPHPKARRPVDLEQEQNLRYVALTRAKEALYFVTD